MRRYSLTRNDGQLWLDGAIAPNSVSASALRRSLYEVAPDRPVQIVVDSPGGSMPEAVSIFTTLKTIRRHVHITIKSAFSAAAIISLAGDQIAITEGGLIGLHLCRLRNGAVDGIVGTEVQPLTANTLRKMARGLAAIPETHEDARRTAQLAEMCEAADHSMLDVLTGRTGLRRTEVYNLLQDETVLDAQQALKLGFVDRIVSVN